MKNNKNISITNAQDDNIIFIPEKGSADGLQFDSMAGLNVNSSDICFEHVLWSPPHPIVYKYNEGESLKEIQSYIDATYEQHYSRNKYQATEFIIDAGHGTGFNIGNMMKYTQRYGRKGDPAEWRKDLMKVIHYAIMQLHVHDTENKD
jgi:hypothetical protein